VIALSYTPPMHVRVLAWQLGWILLIVAGCTADDPPPLVDGGGSDPRGRVRDGGIDGGACFALGCDELGYECGQAVDNCGGPLDCDPPGVVAACKAPERCGGDPDRGPYKCGCKPRENACAAQGANCGTVDECGAPVDCGRCSGGALCLGNRCACAADPDPCGNRACGQVTDACGNTVQCGPSGGQCQAGGVCDPTGQCACPDRAVVCRGRTDAFSENGCTYDCSDRCVPDDVAACAGAACGSAQNNCGQVVPCGPLAGQCAAGSRCVAPQHISDSALPARGPRFQGGYCVADNVASMIGNYASRLHSFRQAGSIGINFLNRAETVSFMSIRHERASGRLSMQEQPCVGAGMGDPSNSIGVSTRTWIPKYRNIKPLPTLVRISGSEWIRDEPAQAVIGSGEPSGWVPGMPSYCVGHEGREVVLPADDPRRGQAWLPGDTCLCPTAATANELPRRAGTGNRNNYATTVLRDCRITDDDRDGKAGVTGRARALLIDSEIYTASIGRGVWRGPIRSDRYHLGRIVTGPRTLETVTLGCRQLDPGCSAPGIDCACGDDFQLVQFVPLADSAPLDCQVFLQRGTDDEDHAAIDRQFGVSFGSCRGSARGQCPMGSICRNDRCFVFSAKGACAPETCPNGNCEGCPDGSSCRADGACWPNASACPPRGVDGVQCRR
jgi:hypothetical protein